MRHVTKGGSSMAGERASCRIAEDDGSVARERDPRTIEVAGGTNEMQRNTIGERVLGLLREPSSDNRKTFEEAPFP
jgi:hypothetical protein